MGSETDSNLTSPVAAGAALDNSDRELSPESSSNYEFSSPSVGSVNNNASNNNGNEYRESHITPRRFRGQTIVAQASSTSKQSTLADDYTPLKPVDLLKVSHKFKSSVDDRSNTMARGRSGSYPGLVGLNNGRRALEEGGNSDRTRRASNDSTGVSPTARSSFDSLLLDPGYVGAGDEEGGIPMGLLFGGSSSGGEYQEIGGQRRRRRSPNGGEPIWSRRMLVMPLVMFAGMGIVALVISSIAWVRERRENPTLHVDASLFPYTVDREKLAANQYSLRLIHTNDMHAHFLPQDDNGEACDPVSMLLANDQPKGSCVGGSAYVKAVVDHLRLGNGVGGKQNTILLNAGDEFQGSVYNTLFKGNMSADLLNVFGIDALALGNHEFDHGPHHLAKYLNKIKASAICANLEFSTQDVPELQAALQPFTLVDRHKVGIIGVLTPETAKSSSVGDGIKITDPVDAVNRMRQKLNELGIRRIIVLSHLGYELDKDLAARVDSGVGLVVGAHTHSYLSPIDNNSTSDRQKGEQSNGPYPTWVTNGSDREWQTAVVQAKSFGQYVGFLDLVFNDDGSLDSRLTMGRPVSVDVISPDSIVHGMAPSKQALSVMQPYLDQAKSFISAEIGQATAEFPAPKSNRDPDEVALGDLITDALVWANKHVPVALLGSGAIRHRLPQGSVTRGDLFDALPFDDVLMAVHLTGRSLRTIVETGISANNNRDSPVLSTLQASGLRWKKPDNDENDEPDIEIRAKIGSTDKRPMEGEQWVSLDNAQTYEVLVPKFLANGGDNLIAKDMIVASRVVVEGLRNLVELYITRFSPIQPILNQRNQ
ncbi:hypothetical protein GGI23_003616 [Coemansia sp. RSA 2559]|nr:hypothetical protein GGI23_003616 [Coemansia sp. RSA 2559]KAJ2858074.1 hypothetical protein GGI22_003376 [Coemansia erecta]